MWWLCYLCDDCVILQNNTVITFYNPQIYFYIIGKKLGYNTNAFEYHCQAIYNDILISEDCWRIAVTTDKYCRHSYFEFCQNLLRGVLGYRAIQRCPDHTALRMLQAMIQINANVVSCNVTKTRCWHVTISCQPDGRPPQPVRPWKSGRVHLAEGSNVVVLELPHCKRKILKVNNKKYSRTVPILSSLYCRHLRVLN